MRKTWIRLLTLAMCATLLAGAGASFAAPEDQLEIGKPAPAFKLPGVDGKDYASSDILKKSKVMVVVWMANHCPVAVDYQDRLIAIQKEYKDKGVALVAISSSDATEFTPDSFENMKKRAAEKKYNFPFLYDESQDVARAYKATCTPHVFVVNAKGILMYRGAVDDSQDAQKVKNSYLRDALDAVLAGKPVEKPTTKQFGCSVKWKKKQ